MHVNNTLISNIRSFSTEMDVSAQIQTIVHQSLGYKAANGPIRLAKTTNNRLQHLSWWKDLQFCGNAVIKRKQRVWTSSIDFLFKTGA